MRRVHVSPSRTDGKKSAGREELVGRTLRADPQQERV